MLINRANLSSAFVAFRTNFRDAFAGVKPEHERIATLINSTTRKNEYGWLGDMPSMREWIGDRVIKSVSDHGYEIVNKPFEMTIGVDRDDFDDDNLGTYAPMFRDMGESAATHPGQLVFELLKNGFTSECFDKQFFFDTDHPVMVDGAETSVSNIQAGGGTPWFLLATNRPLKPIILQMRREPEFVAKDDPNTSDRVFDRKEFRYGVDYRGNVGFGFWQMAFGSQATLDEANFDAAYDAMTAQKNDEGRPLGIVPNLLVVPPQLRKQADEVIKRARKANGEDNTNQNIVDTFMTPWLA
ncbi:MAG: Mu-like prophage major head subunit gpT family protein [Alphaproteobacteria bacterium]